MDIPGDHGTYVGHGGEFLKRHGTQTLHARYRHGKTLGGGLPDVGNRECVQYPLEGHLLRRLDSCHYPLRGLFSHAVKSREFCLVETVQIADVFHQSARIQQFGCLFTDTVDVHHPARAEMFDAAGDLRPAAIFVGAYP